MPEFWEKDDIIEPSGGGASPDDWWASDPVVAESAAPSRRPFGWPQAIEERRGLPEYLSEPKAPENPWQWWKAPIPITRDLRPAIDAYDLDVSWKDPGRPGVSSLIPEGLGGFGPSPGAKRWVDAVARGAGLGALEGGQGLTSPEGIATSMLGPLRALKGVSTAPRVLQALRAAELALGAQGVVGGGQELYHAATDTKSDWLNRLAQAAQGVFNLAGGATSFVPHPGGPAVVEEAPPPDINEPAPVREQGDVLGLEALKDAEPTPVLPDAPQQFHEPVWRGEVPAGLEHVVTAAPDAVGANILDRPLEVAPDLQSRVPDVWLGDVPGRTAAPAVWDGPTSAEPQAPDAPFVIPESPDAPNVSLFPPPSEPAFVPQLKGPEPAAAKVPLFKEPTPSERTWADILGEVEGEEQAPAAFLSTLEGAGKSATAMDALAEASAQNITTPGQPRQRTPVPPEGLGKDFTLSRDATAQMVSDIERERVAREIENALPENAYNASGGKDATVTAGADTGGGSSEVRGDGGEATPGGGPAGGAVADELRQVLEGGPRGRGEGPAGEGQVEAPFLFPEEPTSTTGLKFKEDVPPETPLQFGEPEPAPVVREPERPASTGIRLKPRDESTPAPVRGEVVRGGDSFQVPKDDTNLKIPGGGDNLPPALADALTPPPPKEPPLSGGPNGTPPKSVRNEIQKRRRWFQPWKERVDSMGEPGQKIAGAVRAYEREHEAATSRGAHAAEIATKDLSKAEWAETQRVVDLGEKPTSEKVAKAADAVRTIFKDVAERAKKAGVLIDELEHYWPHQDAEGRWSFDQMVDEYAQQKGVSREQATSELYDARRRAEFTRSRRNAHLERQRTGQLENYRTDKGVIVDYLDAANKRIAEANHFGKNLEKVEGVAKTILDRNDQKYVMDGLLGMTGRVDPTLGSKVSGKVRAAEAATKLLTGALSQLQSTAQTVSRGGVGNTVRSLLEMRSKAGRRAAELEAMRSGGIYDHLSGSGDITGAPKKGLVARLPWLEATAYVDKQQRVLADGVANKVIPQLYEQAQKGSKKAIEALKEIEVDHTQPLTDEALLHGRKTFTDLTQYRTRLSDMPLAASTSLGRVVMQMNNFNYQHGRFLSRTIDLAKKGNYAPLLRYLGAATVLGEVVSDTKGMAKGYGIQGEDADWKDILASKRARIDLGNPDSPISERLQKIAKSVTIRAAQDLAGSGFGIWQTIPERASHAKKVVDIVGGPGLGDVVNIGDETLGRGGRAGLKEAVNRGVPTFGHQITDEFGRSASDAAERGDRPVNPGWVGRMHDVFEGKTTLGEAALRGLITGGSGTPEREDYKRLQEQRAATQAAQQAIESQYPRTTDKEKKTTTEKIGAGKREEKRLGFEKQILDAFKNGDRREAYRIVRLAKHDGFDFSKSTLKNLEAAVEEE